ncbi:MAG: histidine kinase dimerization/phospho-acceptor domain-containing protein [Pirellulales bacterium]
MRIRTPLNGVIGMLDLLASTDLDERQQRYARISRSSATTLLGLINDILDFSKIEAGKMELEQVEFDLPELLDDVCEMFSHRAVSKGLELTCNRLPNVPKHISGDPERLRQVLVNLINNALKFTSYGEVGFAPKCWTRKTAFRVCESRSATPASGFRQRA